MNGPTWYNANFGLAQSFDSIEAVVDTITDLECPADITGAVQTACAAAKNVLGAVFSLLQWVVEFVSHSNRATGMFCSMSGNGEKKKS